MRVNERMVAIDELHPLRVRVWIACDCDFLPTEDEARETLKPVILKAMRDCVTDPRAVAERIAEYDRRVSRGLSGPFVNAVEVVRPDGSGVLIYPDWP